MLYDKPLVSVIIPTFNRKEILLKVIEGVIGQNYPAIELVICDDGSNDGTEEMIKNIRKKINYTIKYINTGTPDEYNLARNKDNKSLFLSKYVGSIKSKEKNLTQWLKNVPWSFLEYPFLHPLE